MPFKSKAQARGAFSGYFGAKMKAKAAQWEDETKGGIKALPERVKRRKKKAKSKPTRGQRWARFKPKFKRPKARQG